jgi:hypothetical protein
MNYYMLCNFLFDFWMIRFYHTGTECIGKKTLCLPELPREFRILTSKTRKFVGYFAICYTKMLMSNPMGGGGLIKLFKFLNSFKGDVSLSTKIMVTVRTIQQFDQVFSEEMQNPAKSVTS